MGNATIRQSAYDFLFDFNRNYVSVFYRFRDKPVIRQTSSQIPLGELTELPQIP